MRCEYEWELEFNRWLTVYMICSYGGVAYAMWDFYLIEVATLKMACAVGSAGSFQF